MSRDGGHWSTERFAPRRDVDHLLSVLRAPSGLTRMAAQVFADSLLRWYERRRVGLSQAEHEQGLRPPDAVPCLLSRNRSRRAETTREP